VTRPGAGIIFALPVIFFHFEKELYILAGGCSLVVAAVFILFVRDTIE